MTMQRYHIGCAAGSQEHGEASNPDYVRVVNFNNGNVNNNHRDNSGYVRFVRRVPASECQGVRFNDLYGAWLRARHRKKPSVNQMRFEAELLDNLVDIQERLNAGTWLPSRSVCFIADAPKAREIHAPAFADRVVHHWLVPQLEAVYETRFIHDSYANRKGKGTHAAVRQLTHFARQVDSGQGGGWFLQLDIANFFNSICRLILVDMLDGRLRKAGLSIAVLHVVDALLSGSPLAAGVTYRATDAERAAVPMHKRLENAASGCGLPIGNLSSQFFANVYLDALDQFVKHQLKAKRYLRYVDDFVIVHRDREQLQEWHDQIVEFLADRLQLRLKPDVRLRPLGNGIDFLCYVIYPTHIRVRRRVVTHARLKLSERTLDAVQRRAVWASYRGHFRHADAYRLTNELQEQYMRDVR